MLFRSEKYGEEYPYLVTKVFDVEKPIKEQGISANYYDLVIAANVLHATKNIRHTLRNAKATLRKHGLLVLNEMSTKNLFCHLTFGLLEGWWLYEDEALRITGSPVLSSASWTDVLTEEGFNSITFPALLVTKSAHDFGQQIVLAESNGIVRQRVQAFNQRKSHTGTSSLTKQNSSREKQLIAEGVSKNRQNFPVLSVTDRETITPQGNSATSLKNLREKAIIYVKNLVGETLQISTNQIDSSEALESYGLDSILVIQLTNNLRKNFKNISNTLFFEVQNIDGVVDYLLANQSDVFIDLLGLSQGRYQTQTREKDQKDIDSAKITNGKNSPLFKFKPEIHSARPIQSSNESAEIQSTSDLLQQSGTRDIAIIGLSGRYPEAENIHDFWQNLKSGKNCINEIPSERWD